MRKEIIKLFFYNQLKYEGYEISRSNTHIKIHDTYKNKIFELPISGIIIEETNRQIEVED